MIHLVRIGFLVVVLSITVSFAMTEEMAMKGADYVTIVVLIPVLAATGAILLDMFWRRKRLQVLSGLFFGLMAGLVIAYILTLIVDLAATIAPSPTVIAHPGNPPEQPPEPAADASQKEKDDYPEKKQGFPKKMSNYRMEVAQHKEYIAHVKTVEMIKFILGAAAVFLCVTIVMQTKDDFRFVIPYVEFAREAKGGRQMLLDTSVIIDGRITDISDTRILDSELIVPRFILDELQTIADSEDKLKRNRGRRGLDVLNTLQTSEKVDIRILDPHESKEEAAMEVDARLVALGQRLSARVMTNDYNLNKVAQLRGVEVININDLANALKPIVLPGETMMVKVIKAGAEPGQGVGYLEDGTMVVVEQGRDQIQKDVGIIVTSVLQTSAGRMIFGKLDTATAPIRPKPPSDNQA